MSQNVLSWVYFRATKSYSQILFLYLNYLTYYVENFLSSCADINFYTSNFIRYPKKSEFALNLDCERPVLDEDHLNNIYAFKLN